MLIIGLFILGFVLRLIPHLPNFTPIIAIALFSGTYLNKKYSLWLPLTLYIISDLIIGLHSVVLFTWSSILIITLLGTILRKRKTLPKILGYTFFSSVLFFIISNFGVWITGWYPQNLAGLSQCYINAIPFFRTSVLANIVYVGILFGIYEFSLQRLKDKKVKEALLLS